MITKTLASKQSASQSLGYNEEKVLTRDNVTRFMVCNIPGENRNAIEMTFDRFEHNPRINKQMTNLGFHYVFSLGPEDDANDPMTDEIMRRYITEWAEAMGYGKQPYVVYLHKDTKHRHYHFVSTRVNAEGRKINDSFEKKRCLSLLEKMAPRYGYTIGAGAAVKANEQRKPNREREFAIEKRQRVWGDYVAIKRFNYFDGDIMEQMRNCLAEALTYNFTSIHQFVAIMAARGIMVRQAKFKGDPKESLVFQGLSRRGVSVTRLYTEDEVNISALELVLGRMQQNKQEHNVQYREKIRVENIAKKLFEWSTSQQHYEKMLKKKGIDVVFSRAEDNPSHIIGATFVDHTVKTAFKASELDKSIAASVFDKAVENGHWKYWDTTKDMDEENYITEWQEDELSKEIRTALNLLGKSGGPLLQNTHGNHAGKTQNQIAWEKQQEEEEQQAQIYQHRM